MATIEATRQQVREFAEAVRDALSDLPADEVDELTDGLEADVSEQVTETGDSSLLADPVAYAEELRVAAGLPPAVRRAPPMGRRLRDWAAGVRDGAGASIRKTRGGSWLLELLLTLAPAWWVIRGWAVFQVAAIVLSGRSPGIIPVGSTTGAWFPELVVLLGLVLISVQWGRGRWLRWSWLRVIWALATVGTIIAIIPLCFAVTSTIGGSTDAGESYSAPAASGVTNGGAEVDNIFAYDADGHLLRNVRLYDQSGNPITTSSDPKAISIPVFTSSGRQYTLVRSPLADGSSGWSVYPLNHPSGSAVHAPYAQVQPLASEPTAEPTATPTTPPSAIPSSGSTPVPTPTPTAPPTPTPAPTATPVP